MSGDAPDTPVARPRRLGRRLLAAVGAAVLLIAGTILALALTEKRIALPDAVERRIEARLDAGLGGMSVDLGRILISLDRRVVPRLWLGDVRLTAADGRELARLGEVGVAFDPSAALRGRVAPRDLRITGASILARRDAEGRFELRMDGGGRALTGGLGGVLDMLDAALASPAFDRVQRVDLQGTAITLEDARSARVWQITDGALVLAREPRGATVSVDARVFNGTDRLARMRLSVRTRAEDGRAEITANLQDADAADIALQSPALSFLGVLDAPISGALRARLDREGALGSAAGTLRIGRGAVQPRAAVPPVPFDSAKAYFSYDPDRARLDFTEISARAEAGEGSASGHVYLQEPGADGFPRAFVGQLRLDRLAVDAPDLLAGPVAVQAGSADLRIRLDPFSVEIGQAVLSHRHGAPPLRLKGRVGAGGDGWEVALDLASRRLEAERLLDLWPLAVAPGSRRWMAANVSAGLLTDVAVALRFAPGDARPRLAASFGFERAEARVLGTWPAIREAAGNGSILGRRFALSLGAGRIDAPDHGPVELGGSTLVVADTSVKPNRARIEIRARGSLTAALSLLDREPLRVMQRAGRAPDLAEGDVDLAARIDLPLRKGNKAADVDFDVSGTLSDLDSGQIVAGRRLKAGALDVSVTPRAIRLAGRASLDGVGFDGAWRQALDGPEKGQSQVKGRIALTPDGLARLGVALPDGLLAGRGSGDLELTLGRGAPPEIKLTSDLRGLALSIPAVNWSKPAATAATFTLTGRLGRVPRIDALTLDAPGLDARGSLTLAEGPRFEALTLDRVRLGGWLDGAVSLRARGQGVPPAIRVTGGTVDIRKARLGGGGGGEGARGPVTLRLDRLVVTDTVSLTGFAADLAPGRAMQGQFRGRVNGGIPVQGTLTGGERGTSIRLQSGDAGAVLRDAGLAAKVVGGAMDVVLQPTASRGVYDGRVVVTGTRLRDAPAMAGLLNAISVVGLIEQMQGQGIVFDRVDADFRLAPGRITLYRSSATGASLGLSMDGVYDPGRKAMDMQGVVSPIYLVNRIGSIFTRQGEGLFGVSFTLKGPVAGPQVSVNPLSILTPGMFREIFRRAPPVRR